MHICPDAWGRSTTAIAKPGVDPRRFAEEAAMPRHHVTRSYPRARLQCTACKTRWLSPPLHCWLNPPSMDPSQGSPRLRHPWHCWLRPSRHCWLRPPWQSCLCPRDRCQWDRRCRCLPNYSQFCDHIGAMLGPFWGHLGVSLRSFWDHLGAILEASWGHLGSSWAS